MMEGVTRRMMMLRPMQAGLSGYARLQEEAGWQLVQINLRGLQGGGMRAFWYAGEGLARELGRAKANTRGEAGLSAELPVDPAAPGRLTALLIADDSDKPRPLAIGLCAAQSAGSLMDAKNALLALCDRLGRMAEEARAAAEKAAAEGSAAGAAGSVPSAARPEECKKGHVLGKAAAQPGGREAAPEPVHPTHEHRLPSPAAGDPPVPQASSPQPEAPHRRKSSRSSAPEPTREVFLPAIEARRPPRRRRGGRPEERKPEDGAVLGKEPCREDAGCAMDGGGCHPAADARFGCGKPPVCGSAETPHQPAGAASGQVSGEQLAAAHPAADHPAASGIRAGHGAPEVRTSTAAPPPTVARTAPPADLLPPLRWPAPYESLAGFFHSYPPVGLMNWPGWRFVHVPGDGAGMWIGCRQQDGLVRQVAYALPGDAEPPRGGAFRPARSAQGFALHLLVLECGEQIFPPAGICPSGSEMV